jgi:hypothetical protein
MPDLTDDESDALTHRSTYGQSGTPSVERFVPTPEERARFRAIAIPQSADWRYDLDANQTQGLLRGYRSPGMEEKWDIWSDEASASASASGGGATSVSFCRSWTGRTIVRVELQLTDAGAHVVRGTWEMDTATVKTPSEQFARDTFESCCAWVLGIARPVPSTT